MKIPVFDGKAELEAARLEIQAAIEGATEPVVEVVVPKRAADELCAWVEGFGVRCAIVHGFKIVDGAQQAESRLVVSLDKAPRVEEAV